MFYSAYFPIQFCVYPVNFRLILSLTHFFIQFYLCIFILIHFFLNLISEFLPHTEEKSDFSIEKWLLIQKKYSIYIFLLELNEFQMSSKVSIPFPTCEGHQVIFITYSMCLLWVKTSHGLCIQDFVMTFCWHICVIDSLYRNDDLTTFSKLSNAISSSFILSVSYVNLIINYFIVIIIIIIIQLYQRNKLQE